ncbi:MAG: hypothetical protein QOH39_1326 [Verrucomicrobiota bacterium]|jgi:hypothetical protein
MKLSGAQFGIVLALFLAAIARGGTEPEITTSETTKSVPIDIFDTENTYVFGSDLNHGGSFGQQDEIQNHFYYAHRFEITGNWYARAGAAYDRFDFSNTTAPVPVHLQSGAAVFSVDYMHGQDIGAMLEVRPGFYTEEHLGLASFDCPITLIRFWVLQPNKLYILTGANYSFLRGGIGIVPVAGFVWVPNKQFRIMAVPSEPRAIYSLNRQIDLYLGGEIEGGSFRTDHHDSFLGIPHVGKLSGTQVDFEDYRAGGGIVWSPRNEIDIDLGAGYSIERAFLFHRAGENYRTDPSPYVRLEIKARF